MSSAYALYQVPTSTTPASSPRRAARFCDCSHRANGISEQMPVMVRIDTPIEIEYYRHGGILPYVLRQLVAAA